ERLAGCGHPRRSPDEQSRRVNVHLHVGELEGDALVLDDRPTELLALLGVVERVLVGRTGDAGRLGADRGDDDVHVGDTPVGYPGLGAVEYPLVGRFVVDGPRSKRRDVTTRVGFGDAEPGGIDALG